jgi:phenylalanyl-tRNA synthetase beta chain
VKISANWIKDYVNLDGVDIKDLWYRFTMSTAEIEELTEMGKEINQVVVGYVVKVEPHPVSPKLKIVQVDLGNEVVQTVCGAPNVKEGQYVPFAKTGGSIRKVARVEAMKVSGVESNGIICSPAEIGISDSHEGILELAGPCQKGVDIKKMIDIADTVIEIDNKSLTNRPDLWGHYGIAREVAAILKRPLKPMALAEVEQYNNLPAVDVKIEDSSKCFRYSCLNIENIKVKVTPVNMAVRLYYCGLRPIAPLVDLTNYLMLETGQPMHAFDKKYIEKIVVKSTAGPSKFTSLDGEERDIPEGVLMICNQEKPVALAGIMGGENSEISDDTESLTLESANFEGSSIRKSAVKIGLRTEASARFEKMLDPNLTTVSIQRFLKLLQNMQPGVKVTSSMTDAYPKRLEPISLTIEKSYIDRYIGNLVASERIVDILKSLEFGVKQEGETFVVDVPSFRSTKDITRKVDIIEEITRIYGYDNIVPRTIKVDLKPLNYNEDKVTEHKIKEILAEKFGFSEVNSYVWYDNNFNTSVGIGLRGSLKLLNPSTPETDQLRDSLAPVMIAIAEKNMRFFDDFSLFEIGSVFQVEGLKSKCQERKNLCLLTAGKSRNEDSLFYELKGVATYLLKMLKKVEPEYRSADNTLLANAWVHPVKAVEIYCNGESLGYISVLHPEVKQNINKKVNVAVLELNASAFYGIGEQQIMFQEPSRYPEVRLDFNFLAGKENSFDRVVGDIGEFRSEILTDFRFIDIYSGKGIPEDKKSMTFRFNIGSKEKTLSSEEIEQFSRELLRHMENKGYSLR